MTRYDADLLSQRVSELMAGGMLFGEAVLEARREQPVADHRWANDVPAVAIAGDHQATVVENIKPALHALVDDLPPTLSPQRRTAFVEAVRAILELMYGWDDEDGRKPTLAGTG